MLSGLPPDPQPWENGPLTLFHGTIGRHVQSVLAGIDLAKCQGYRDFGRGFYTTTWFAQAAYWAQEVADAADPRDTPAVIAFTVDRDLLAGLDTLCFVRDAVDAADYWSLVWHCRRDDGDHARLLHGGWYDLVVGPVTAFWRQQRIAKDYDQWSFHTIRATQFLNSSRSQRVL